MEWTCGAKTLFLGLVMAIASTTPAFGMPVNDVRSRPAPIHSDDQNLTGLRTIADAPSLGGPVIAQAITGTPDDVGDPTIQAPLVNSDLSPTCEPADTTEPAGSHSVWFKLTDPDGGRFKERTLVTLDTLASYANAIVIYRGSIPSDAVDSAPYIVACARRNAGNNAIASFVADPSVDYYAEVVALLDPTSGSLNLFMRALDIQQPQTSLTADSPTAQPGKTTMFTLQYLDQGAGPVSPPTMIKWSVRLRQSGRSDLVLPVIACPASLSSLRSLTGCYDTSRQVLFVHWPLQVQVGKKKVPAKASGFVGTTVVDAAGNVKKDLFLMDVRDTIAPGPPDPVLVALSPRRRTARVTGRCTEAGQLRVRVSRYNTADSGVRHALGLRGRGAAWRAASLFKRLRHRQIYTVNAVCVDRSSNNSSGTFTFFYMP